MMSKGTIASRVFIAVVVLLLAANAGLLTMQFVNDDIGDPGYVVLHPPTIDYISPKGAAARAGLRVGDRVDLAKLDLHGRLVVLGYTTPIRGDDVTIPIVRAGVSSSLRVVFMNVQTAFQARNFRVLFAFVAACIIGLALVLLARHPAVVTFALAAQTLAYSGYLLSVYRAPDWFIVTNTAYSDAIQGIWVSGAAILALRVTNLSSTRRYLEGIAVAVGTCIALLDLLVDFMQIALTQSAPTIVIALTQSSSLVLFVVAVAPIMAFGFLRADDTTRVRLRWIALGFVFFTGEAIVAYAQNTSPALFASIALTYARPTLAIVAMAMLAVAIVRRDMFDIGFVVNRATIYAVLTGLLIGIFAGLNWLVGSALKSTGLALPVAVILAGGVALSLQAAQRRVTLAVDRVLFRRRYEAEQRLAHLARAVPHLIDDDALARALVGEPVATLELAAGALYRRREDGSYQLSAATGWPSDAPATIAAADPLVLYVTGITGGLRLDHIAPEAAFPNGALRPRTAFAVPGADGAAAIVLYAAHRNGAALDPDESAALEHLATVASVAFERSRVRSSERRLDDVLAALGRLQQRLDGPTTTRVDPFHDRA